MEISENYWKPLVVVENEKLFWSTKELTYFSRKAQEMYSHTHTKKKSPQEL